MSNLEIMKSKDIILQKTVVDHDVLINHIKTLSSRINDRFPNSSLNQYTSDFYIFSTRFRDKTCKIHKTSERFLIGKIFLICISIFATGKLFYTVNLNQDLTSFISQLDAVCNIIVVFSALFFTLYSLDKSYSRNKISQLLIELKNFVHVADMHQINKDPNHLKDDYIKTENSPSKKLNKFELQRYLDYTSECISLASKLSCIILDYFPNDQEISLRINQFNIMCDGITTNIWQKIIILNSLEKK